MTTDLDEPGFYVRAGAPSSPAELLDEVPAADALALRIGVHLGALQHQGGQCALSRSSRTSCYATVPDSIPADLRLKKTVGRLATYLQGYGDLMVRTNGWDPAPPPTARQRCARNACSDSSTSASTA